MAEQGYVATHYLHDIDSCELERQYRLLRDLPDGRFITPEIKRRMFRMGEIASEALARLRSVVPAPVKPNAYPRAMRDAPSLIDDKHWEKIHEGLRRQGKILPCDYMFGGRDRLVESFASDETIRPVERPRSRSQTFERTNKEPILLELDQEGIDTQGCGDIISRLLCDFGKAVRAVTGKALLS